MGSDFEANVLIEFPYQIFIFDSKSDNMHNIVQP